MTMTKRKKCYKTGKQSFDTEMEANIHISTIRLNIVTHRKHRFREEPVRSYECEFCGKWHTTSQAKRRGS